MMERNLIKKILREEVEYEVEENLFPYTETIVFLTLFP